MLHDDHSFAQVGDYTEIMRDEKNCQAQFFLQFLYELKNFSLD